MISVNNKTKNKLPKTKLHEKIIGVYFVGQHKNCQGLYSKYDVKFCFKRIVKKK